MMSGGARYYLKGQAIKPFNLALETICAMGSVRLPQITLFSDFIGARALFNPNIYVRKIGYVKKGGLRK